ncbi:MAG: type II toxin-antitoxin system VapC family toxin [Acetobacteraceae bacterium]
MYLLDTCVLSEAQRHSSTVLGWLRSVPEEVMFVSVLTLGEIELGIEKLRRRKEPKVATLEAWLRGIRTAYRDRILAIDDETALAWGRLAVPRSRPVVDSLIAATALVHRKIVVTRNVADFADMGLEILNPWTE